MLSQEQEGKRKKFYKQLKPIKKQVVAKAEGEASRFVSIFNEYDKAKEVTQERMYLETMEKVLADIEKVIIEKNAGSGCCTLSSITRIK
jgi:membrane protease subunit HflK